MTENLQIAIQEKNIVFTGFMGVGKTAIGQLVAEKLNRDFIDIDLEIEKKHQLPIPEIFRKFGEPHFRQLEKEFIIDTCRNSRFKVISLGGGAYLQEEVRKVCLSRCVVYFLDLSWEAWKSRLPLIIDTRPVLKNKTLEEMEELFKKRYEVYSIHHFKICIDHLDFEAAADQIVESLNSSGNPCQPKD